MIIVGSLVWFVLKFLLCKRSDLTSFDKVHAAIERNLDNSTEEISFNNPLLDEEIRRPTSFYAKEKRELVLALRELGAYERLLVLRDQKDNFNMAKKSIYSSLPVYGFFFFGIACFTALKWSWLAESSVWWDLLGLFIISLTLESLWLLLVSLNVIDKLEKTELYSANRNTINKIAESINKKDFTFVEMIRNKLIE